MTFLFLRKGFLLLLLTHPYTKNKDSTANGNGYFYGRLHLFMLYKNQLTVQVSMS